MNPYQSTLPTNINPYHSKTGWERERAAWLGLVRGAAQDETLYDPAVLDLADPDGNFAALRAGLGALASVGSLLNDDGEDPETKRHRREAEQNGADLGAAIGLAIGLIGLADRPSLPTQATETIDLSEDDNDPAQTLGGI